MLRSTFTSSNVSEALLLEGELYLTFKKGSVYKYANAGLSTYMELLEAPSAGKFFHSDIKPAYEGVRLSDEEVRSLNQLVTEAGTSGG